MTKKITLISMVLALAMSLIVPTVMAKQKAAPDLPGQAGIYAVPGRPDLKLRVFVYHAKPDKPDKPGKPEPPAPELICDGILDPDSSAEVSAAEWKLSTEQNWVYYLNSASVPSFVGFENLAEITNNAFERWLLAINNKVNVVNGGETELTSAKLDGQNIISWGRTSPKALAVTYIWYNTQTGKAVEIDTLMNSRVNWAWSDPNSWSENICAYEDAYDAQNILTHELGHTFGLLDEYTAEYVNNTMYGYGDKMEVKKDTLTNGDVAGVSKIY